MSNALAKLRPTVKKAWVKALRSGEFKQGTGALCREKKNEKNQIQFEFCCLGVICALGKKQDWHSNYGFWGYGDSSVTAFPPRAVSDKMFVESSSITQIEHVFEFLAEMNDDGKDFDEIADWIEENL